MPTSKLLTSESLERRSHLKKFTKPVLNHIQRNNDVLKIMDHFDTFKSLRIISQFIGLAPHFIHVNSHFEKTLYIKSLNYINTILTLLIFISLTIFKNVMYASQDPGKCFLFQLITKGNHFEVYSGIIIVFLIYSLSFIYRKERIQIEETIYEVDRTFKKLNVTIPFKKLQKNVTLLTVTLLMFDLIVLFITNVFSGNLQTIIIAFIELLPGIITTISNCYFISYMICLKYRIKSLNIVLIRNCSEYSSNVSTINQRMINEHEIDMIMKIHVRICDIFDLINQYFGVILFCILSQLFILIVLFVYIASKLLLIAYIYNGDDYRDMALVIIYVALTYAFKIFFIILSTNFLLNEVGNTQTFIHKTINCVQVKKLQNKVSFITGKFGPISLKFFLNPLILGHSFQL